MVRALSSMLAGVVLATASSAFAQQAEDARHWLEKMVHAAHTMNYDGTFVYQSGGRMESMRIIHRRDESGVRERLLSLTGVAREVLRDNSRVTCILPDDASVMVGNARSRGVNSGPLFSGASVPAHYELELRGLDRIAGRVAERVDLTPRDEYRYGFRLWIDRQTGLLLRSDVVGSDSQMLETVAYTSVSLPQHIPDSLLEPGIKGDGFRWVTWEEKDEAVSPPGDHANWQVNWLPEGFELTEHAVERREGDAHPVDHLVFSDGLASVSMFIEPLDPSSVALDGHSRMGAVSAFGRMVGKHQVTVVGAVPAVTVEAVGMSVLPPR